MTNTKGIRRPRGEKAGVKITSGEYTGWWCYGPYYSNSKKRGPRAYYRLVNKDQKINIEASQIDIEGIKASAGDKKPFLDFL